MSRSVIRLEERVLGDGVEVEVIFRPEEPRNVPERTRWRTLQCDLAQAPFSDLAAVAAGSQGALPGDLVRSVGEAIHQALREHPGIAAALDQAAATEATAEHPVRLLTEAFGAESIPWEALYHPAARFLALDPRFSLSRVVATGSGRLERIHQSPLRMAAVLAARDRDAEGEWQGLRQAVERSGIALRLTLFVAQDDLETAVQSAALPWVEVRRVPDEREELLAQLELLRPQLLHIYSHAAAGNEAMMEVATPGSISGLDERPIYLDAQHFSTLVDDLWLVTLDACEGATPTRGAHSLAYSLVDAGIPSAIGMREVIDSRDANAFCAAFYRAALVDLRKSLVPGSETTIDWAPYLSRSREALCSREQGPPALNAAKSKPWTLPVLYRRAEDLVVSTPQVAASVSASDEERIVAELQLIKRALATLHPDNPPTVGQQLRQRIAQLEAQLAAN